MLILFLMALVLAINSLSFFGQRFFPKVIATIAIVSWFLSMEAMGYLMRIGDAEPLRPFEIGQYVSFFYSLLISILLTIFQFLTTLKYSSPNIKYLKDCAKLIVINTIAITILLLSFEYLPQLVFEYYLNHVIIILAIVIIASAYKRYVG